MLSGSSDRVYLVSTSSWEITASFFIEADAANPSDSATGLIVGYGEILQASGDGKSLSIITTAGVERINLALVQMYAVAPRLGPGQGDEFDNVLTGTAADDVLEGKAGTTR